MEQKSGKGLQFHVHYIQSPFLIERELKDYCHPCQVPRMQYKKTTNPWFNACSDPDSRTQLRSSYAALIRYLKVTYYTTENLRLLTSSVGVST